MKTISIVYTMLIMALVQTKTGVNLQVSAPVNGNNPDVGRAIDTAGGSKTLYPGDTRFGRVGDFGTVVPDKFTYTGSTGGTYCIIGDSSGTIAALLLAEGITVNNPASCPLGSTAGIVTAWRNRLGIKYVQYKALKLITSSDADQFNNPFTYYTINPETNRLQPKPLDGFIQLAANPMAQNDKIREFMTGSDLVIGTDSALVFKVDEAETLTVLGTALLK